MNPNNRIPEDWYKEKELHHNVKALIVRLKNLEAEVKAVQGLPPRSLPDWATIADEVSTEHRLAALEAKMDIILQHITGLNRDRQE